MCMCTVLSNVLSPIHGGLLFVKVPEWEKNKRWERRMPTALRLRISINTWLEKKRMKKNKTQTKQNGKRNK